MRYQFQSQHGQISWRPKYFTEAIKILIGVNAALFFFDALLSLNLSSLFGLSPKTVIPMIWQPFSYLFIHGGVWHLLINMLVLWMFGSELESIWGKSQFIKYYLITGVGSGLVWLLFNLSHSNMILIGASGAIYGILLAYGMMFPNRTVLLYFVVPVKVKWFVLFIGVLAFYSSLGAHSNISHLTHLSGMIIGYFYLRSNGKWKHTTFSLRKLFFGLKHQWDEKRHQNNLDREETFSQLLEKINENGFENLTENEKSMFDSLNQHFSKTQTKN